jgi:hypothetical protein
MYTVPRTTPAFPGVFGVRLLDRRLLMEPSKEEHMMRTEDVQRDTPAWLFQVWASFVLSIGVTAVGVAYMPVDPWVRAFLGMGLLFSVGSSLSLAKTLRDNHEAKRLLNKLSEAKTEKILRDFELGDATRPAAA